mmetsp:Transcript_112544/g.350814  ORF Transcript_112544/g.350814 Transcript_112544/m.350814 type:complete len:117 (-) Transcript_112544:254-604(-)
MAAAKEAIQTLGSPAQELLSADAPEFETITVDVAGRTEQVQVDIARGPMVYLNDGSRMPMKCGRFSTDTYMGGRRSPIQKKWSEMSPSEQSILIHMAGKKNMRYRERYPALFPDKQ